MWIVPIISTLSQLVSRQHSDLQGVSANQHHAQTHSVGDHTNVTRRSIAPILTTHSGGSVSVSGLCPVYALPDGSTGYVYIAHLIPSDFIGGLSYEALFVCAPSSVVARMEFNFSLIKEGFDPTSDTVNVAPYNQSLDGGGLLESKTISPAAFSAVPAKGDLLGIEIIRYGGHANDDINDVLHFVGMKISYEAEQ